jgi:hypothetical protein
MPMFKLVSEDGVWLEDARLGVADWKPGDRIAQGRDSLEVVEVTRRACLPGRRRGPDAPSLGNPRAERHRVLPPVEQGLLLPYRPDRADRARRLLGR